MKMKLIANRILYSFPLQLAIMHLKKNHLMLLYWLLLFGFVTQTLSSRFGIPYLFLDPEYMGKVSWVSFFIMGVSLGAFIMAFNISGYILNSFRFPFLATMSRTFIKFVHNNFLLPTAFLATYTYSIYEFQSTQQLKSGQEVLTLVGAMLVGVTIVILITLRYFMMTNKDIFKLFGVAHSDTDDSIPVRPRIHRQNKKHWRVETYLIFPMKVKLVRDTRHYKRYMLEKVFRQNHINAALLEIFVFATFILLGLFRENPYFRIPAGSSVLLLLTMFIMLFGVFRYWLRAWATTGLIAFFLLVNYLSQFEVFNPRNRAYGLDYTTSPALYDRENLDSQINDSILDHDKAQTISILQRWKEKWSIRGIEKPKLVLINVSGGGLRSSVFTFRTLQMIDSAYGGDLMHHTAFATGSSGGIIGLCYYRDLFLNNKDSIVSASRNPENKYLKTIGKDMLNSLAVSATVADIFLNNQYFKDGEHSYIKDRAWAWELQLNENTEGVMDKRLRDYEAPEREAQVPMVVISPTIINDGRALHISAQPVSYLLSDEHPGLGGNKPLTNGVEFRRFFGEQQADNLRMTSALRMNSAFPYVMPAVSLPSEPAIEVMDAGIRDNYGIMNSTQFLHTFRDWIGKNTSGVVMLQIRDNFKNPEIEDNSIKTIFEKLLAPMRNVSGNFIIMQDYNLDKYMQYAGSWLDVPLEVIVFQMPESDRKVSISWHLTEKEKAFVKSGSSNPENKASLQRLLKAIPPVQ